MTEVKYLAIDPGISNGICGYNELGHIQFMQIVTITHLVKFLEKYKKINTVIVEGYRVFPNKAKDHIYSDLATPRAIGKIEYWAEANEITLVKQPSHIKATGYKFLGRKPWAKSDPRNHTGDAHAHFTYWAVTTGLIKAEDLLKSG